MSKLITASPETSDWVKKIRKLIEKEKIQLKYGESKHWASFKSLESNRNIAYLNPTKNQIRLFTRLDSKIDSSLQMTPSTGRFAEMYPSVFFINSELLLDEAVKLIKLSYEYDLKPLESIEREIEEDIREQIQEDSILEEQEFVLEKYLEDFIVTNFNIIFNDQDIELYVDEEKNSGQQYSTAIGRIDILAQEQSTNSFIVIELKKGKESDVVVGQMLRYMGWVKENLCKKNEKVKGLIICKDIDDKLCYALKMIPDITVKRYKISFELSE